MARYACHILVPKVPATDGQVECGRAFTSASLLKQHRESEHAAFLALSRSQDRLDKLAVQEARAGTASKTCPVCGTVFLNADTLRSHSRKSACNPDRPSFPCSFEGCGKVYMSKTNLTLHVRTVHEGHRPRFVCRVEGCSESFLRRPLLIRHLRTHGVAPKKRIRGPSEQVLLKRRQVDDDDAEFPDQAKRRRTQDEQIDRNELERGKRQDLVLGIVGHTPGNESATSQPSESEPLTQRKPREAPSL
jgi:Zinc finger, C2H2 type